MFSMPYHVAIHPHSAPRTRCADNSRSYLATPPAKGWAMISLSVMHAKWRESVALVKSASDRLFSSNTCNICVAVAEVQDTISVLLRQFPRECGN